MISASDFKARYALYHWDAANDASIQILLDPFQFMGESVSSSIRLDGIEGLDADLRYAQGRTYEFPVNPAPGYIDGSVYFYGRHHSLDVTQLRFGFYEGNSVGLTLVGTLLLEGLEEVSAIPVEIETRVELPLSHRELERRVREAISVLSASSSKDMGRVVSKVKTDLLYATQVAEAAKIAARLLGHAGS